jgi:hypothetical protein
MESRVIPLPINQPCAQISLQIGQAIAALEAIGRMPSGEMQTSLAQNLEQHLGALQSEYEANCLGKKSKGGGGLHQT